MTSTPRVVGGVLVPAADPLFSVGERQASAPFLAGYSGLTRDAYTLDLRQYTAWCTGHGLPAICGGGGRNRAAGTARRRRVHATPTR